MSSEIKVRARSISCLTFVMEFVKLGGGSSMSRARLWATERSQLRHLGLVHVM